MQYYNDFFIYGKEVYFYLHNMPICAVGTLPEI